MRKRLIALMLSVLAVNVGTASAEITFDLLFRPADGNDQRDAVVDITPGQSLFGVQLVLRETVTNGDDSYLAASNLNAYAANISLVSGDGSFSSLGVLTDGGFAPPGGNDADSIAFAAIGQAFGQPGRVSSTAGVGVREAILGSVTLRGPVTGQAKFALTDASNNDGDYTTFASGMESGLESLAVMSGGTFNNGSITLNAVAVPEPSTALALLGGLGCLIATGRRRRRRK